MEIANGNSESLTEADLRQARLIALALRSLSDDVAPLVAGHEISEDVLDSATWFDEGDTLLAAEIDGLLDELRSKLRSIGCRGLLFIASEQHLSDKQ